MSQAQSPGRITLQWKVKLIWGCQCCPLHPLIPRPDGHCPAPCNCWTCINVWSYPLSCAPKQDFWRFTVESGESCMVGKATVGVGGCGRNVPHWLGVGFAGSASCICVHTRMSWSLHSKASSVGNSCLNSTRKYLANHMLTCLSC